MPTARLPIDSTSKAGKLQIEGNEPWYRRLSAGLRYPQWRLCRLAAPKQAKYKADVRVGQTCRGSRELA